ncbi:SDR family NAD(P)-dependent oxidoreductase [Mesobacillus maritimus]|uniref:SDR family NAD(P)-dependent oxidoreductase n=1 Tax=Mesobacillus maritimus TaxID=1643336 RepID=UPI00384F6E0E
MIDKKQGNIVNVASLSGLRGVYGNSAYTASKFALIGWTQCMAVEAIQHQIRVNAVCPGFVETDMAESLISSQAQRNQLSFEVQLNNVKQGIPSGRLTSSGESLRHNISQLI